MKYDMVEQVPVKDILLNTGTTRTLVCEDLVPAEQIVEGKVTIRCAQGDIVTYPLTKITVQVYG